MASEIKLKPIATDFTIKDHLYEVIRDHILSIDIYAMDEDLRLDERQLASQLGVSRTPIREVLARLAQDGLVEILPRKGVFIHRKSMSDILDMVITWAARRATSCYASRTTTGDHPRCGSGRCSDWVCQRPEKTAAAPRAPPAAGPDAVRFSNPADRPQPARCWRDPAVHRYWPVSGDGSYLGAQDLGHVNCHLGDLEQVCGRDRGRAARRNGRDKGCRTGRLPLVLPPQVLLLEARPVEAA